MIDRDMALRHVVEGRRIVASQRQRIARLRWQGLDISVAESLLQQFERSLAIIENDFAAITDGDAGHTPSSE